MSVSRRPADGVSGFSMTYVKIHIWHAPQLVMNDEFGVHEVAVSKSPRSDLQDAF